MKSILALAFLLLVGCGVGLEDSGNDTARDAKNEKLRGEYDDIKGTYEGNIKIVGVDKPFAVKFFMFWGEIQEAPLPGDLKPGLRVVLRGRLMQSDFVGDSDNLILTGLYDGVNGSVTLDPDLETSKTSTGCRLGGQDPVGIRADLNGDTLSGVVLRNGQEWARLLDLKRTTREVSSGAVLSEEEEYRRLQEIYRPVTGTYNGKLSRQLCAKGAAAKEDFSLLMYIERKQEGTGLNGSPCYVPRLTARTLRNFSGELADETYRSVNRFDPLNYLPQFQSLNPATGSRTAILDLKFDSKSAALGGQISTSGVWGRLNVTRTTTDVSAPADETVLYRERRERTYALFTGEYKGTVVPYKKSKENPPWWVIVSLYQDEAVVNGTRVPILMAHYKRQNSGTDDTIGSRLMNVDAKIDACVPLLVMQSDQNSGPAPIPGIGRMHFTSEWVNGAMKGELVDHRGPQGIMTLKK